MDKTQLLGSLQQITGNLKPNGKAERNQLDELERSLAQALLDHPELSVTGNQLLNAAGTEQGGAVAARLTHLADLLRQPPTAGASAPAPLIFRRETAFRNNLLGGSVPDWGVGLAPSQSFGPISSEHGLPIWFDFFLPTRLVSVGFSAAETALAVPIFGLLTPRRSYRIEPGSVWIASALIAQDPGLAGYFTGLKIMGGTLELSRAPTISAGRIEIAPGSIANVRLDLAPNTVTGASAEAGFDATDAVVATPNTVSLRFNQLGSTFTAGDGSSTVFGCTTKFHFVNKPAVWLPQFSQILIPYSAKTDSPSGDVFTVKASRSRLCKFSGQAKLDTTSGWLIPTARIDPHNLGQAAGTGALVVLLRTGIEGTWKGLAGEKTRFLHPAIIAEPGMVTVVDFFAENVYGRQRWRLWQNSGSRHHSEMVLDFGKAFPFVYVSSSAGNEAVTFFCREKASLDRPVDANGHPFKIESLAALASIFQKGKKFHVALFDADLLLSNPVGVFERSSIVLRNAFFSVSLPHSLFVFGELVDDSSISNGVLILSYAVLAYIPTLPDPYVTNYVPLVRGRAGAAASLDTALVGVVSWPDPEQVPANAAADNNPAVLDFRLLPLNPSQLAPAAQPAAGQPASPLAALATDRNFRTGLRTLNQPLNLNIAASSTPLAAQPASFSSLKETPSAMSSAADARARIESAIVTGGMKPLIQEMEASPLLAHIPNKPALIDSVLSSSLRQPSVAEELPEQALAAVGRGETALFRDFFMLLDVSTNADQMGVSLGTALQVEQTPDGGAVLRSNAVGSNVAVTAGSTTPLQIDKLDVTIPAVYLRAVTLPQVSWEPFVNIPLAIEGPPAFDDLITVTPGAVLCDNDGPPTRIASESPVPVPIAPLPATSQFVKEYNDQATPRALHSSFALPFSMVAQANFEPKPHSPPGTTTSVSLNQPFFDALQGGLQIKVRTLTPKDPAQSASFPGWAVQLDNLKWFIAGFPISGSTLGQTVKKIFNGEFSLHNPQVPLEGMEVCGYGASIFSNWRNSAAKIAEVSQALFNVLVGRTAHEIVQVRSILYPFGVHVVRTITLLRSPNGYVFRSDSGWKAESDGFFDFSYTINFHNPVTDKDDFPDISIPNSYTFHQGTVKGVSNVREIRDFPSAGPFKSSFTPNDSGLPLDFPRWKFLFNDIKSMTDPLPVDLEPVVFDADVHLDNVISGGAAAPGGDFIVQSRKMLGYVQAAPPHVLIPPKVFADLLNFQNGSLGGPVDCIIDVNKSGQRMRLSRVDVSPARDGAGNYLFVTAERGSFILPKDGSWSVAKLHTDTGDVQPLEQGSSVPLIQTNGDPVIRAANPADVVQTTSNINFGVMQSTGTQKLLFSVPQFSPGIKKLRSADTFFADAYKLLNAKGVFPNIANALGLEAPQKELSILGEGLLRMSAPNIKLKNLLSGTYQYTFINEPGVLKVYVEYGSDPATGDKGQLDLDINSAASSWKSALSNIRVVVDLGPLPRLMWVDGNFDAASGIDAKYNKPNLQFSGLLKTAKDILLVLERLSGDDFDNGMKVGMSNSPESFEYKFDCSQEIPVIKFPTPTELAVDPTPPLKLEAGLRVGFYFNEVISIPTGLSQLVPAAGGYVDFFGRVEVQCFTLAIASVYGVGQVNLGIAADSKAGKLLRMRFGFGAEIVVGLPVVLNVSVLYVVGVQIDLGDTSLTVGASLLFRGSADICDGLISICIQIEAAGSIQRTTVAPIKTNCIAQVEFSIDVSVAWVIDISFSDHWQETRQIA